MYKRQELNIVEIEFLESNYVIDQLKFFDATSSGLMTFEWSLNGEDWFPLTEYYTNRGEVFRIRENDDPMTPGIEILEGFGAWQTLSNFEQPEFGIRFLRVTSTVTEARITELFICGRPACENNNPIVVPTCNTADFAVCAESTLFSEIEIQGNSGIETHPVDLSNFNYPGSFFNENGSNQLIPGVLYTPEIETCSGSNCTTEILPFTANTTNCLLDNDPIASDSKYIGGCGTYTFQVDANVGDQVQVWLSHAEPFNSTTIHPLEQNPGAEMMVLTVEPTNVFGGIRNVITVPYDRCERAFFLAYRYFTGTESSFLHTLELTRGGNIAPFLSCVCSGPSGGPTTEFIIDGCTVTDIIYNNLEVGERLRNREVDIPSTGGSQLLVQEIHDITSPEYIYHLSHPNTAERLRVQVNESSPWVTLNLTHAPCIITSPPNSGSERDQEIEDKFDLNTALKLYPNPTRDNLNVEITESANLLLIGVDGKSHDLRDLRRTSYGYQFSTSHLIPGLYLLRTIDETGKTQTGKFMVTE